MKILTIVILLLYNITICQTIDFVTKFGEFNSASSFDIDLQGNIYVADALENTITKVDSSGLLVNSIGGYGWETSAFDEPYSIYSTTLSIYVADKNNNRIQRFDKDLNFLSEYSGNENSDVEFAYPTCVAISRIGDLYLLDSDNYRILKFNLNGNFLLEIGSQDAGAFTLIEPKNFSIDSKGNIFVLDKDRIKVFDQYGTGKINFEIDFTPNMIYIHNEQLFYITNNAIRVLDLKERKLNDAPINFLELENETISDIKIFNKFLFVLTPTSVLKYRIFF